MLPSSRKATKAKRASSAEALRQDPAWYAWIKPNLTKQKSGQARGVVAAILWH